MGDLARQLLQTFKALPESEQSEVLVALLRATAVREHAFPDDLDLLRAADELFLELDRREAGQ